MKGGGSGRYMTFFYIHMTQGRSEKQTDKLVDIRTDIFDLLKYIILVELLLTF